MSFFFFLCTWGKNSTLSKPAGKRIWKIILLMDESRPWLYVADLPKYLKTVKKPLIICFSSVQLFSCVRLCDPMNCSMPGLPVHHHFPEFTQTHVHRVSGAIQPSHPLSPHSPPAINLSHSEVNLTLLLLKCDFTEWYY